MPGSIHFKDGLEFLRAIGDDSVDMVYVDPPFNTGKTQKLQQITVAETDGIGDRDGFGGKRYDVTGVGVERSYVDNFRNFKDFIKPFMQEFRRILKPTGTLYFHMDYREVHYCKVWLDGIFGRANFVNEVIWTFDYGARTKKRWPAKHQNILMYAKNEDARYFDIAEVDKLPYMSPSLVGPEKTAFGKSVTDTFWLTICTPNERWGYPTQKPLRLLDRLVKASCPKDGLIVDCFAGSGTTGESALNNGRNFLMCDNNQDAIDSMKLRFDRFKDKVTFVL